MTVLGIDYAWTHPDPAAIAADGYTFACRYLSRDSSKNLTLAEAQALAAHGVWCVANWEYTAQDALRGYAGGVADATLALRQATAAGMPPGRPIYFSVDWDVTPAQEDSVTSYLAGADSVLGLSATGEYAGFYPLKVQRDAGVSSWEWQPAAWSGGQWEPQVNIRQTGTATVGGVQVDVNQAMTADYGQWTPGRLPPQAQGASVTIAWSDTINGPNGRPNGNQAQYVLTDLGRLRDYLTGDATAAAVYGPGSPLGQIVAAAQAVPGLVASVAVLQKQLAALATPPAVDVAALAAALASTLGPALETAAAQGVQLTADQFTVTLEQHLGAALSAAAHD